MDGYTFSAMNQTVYTTFSKEQHLEELFIDRALRFTIYCYFSVGIEGIRMAP